MCNSVEQVSCSFDYLTRSAANLAYNYCLLGFEFVLPVTVIVACYVGIVLAVRRQSKELQGIGTHRQEPANNADDREQRRLQLERRQQERRLAKVCSNRQKCYGRVYFDELLDLPQHLSPLYCLVLYVHCSCPV